MKFCKNCKYSKKKRFISCQHPHNMEEEISLVNGMKTIYENNDCWQLRSENGICGLEGKLFEEKTSFWQKLFKK